MKKHFIKMFHYDRFANEQILKAIIDANVPTQPLKLMAHLLVAERVWLDRCLGLPLFPHDLWPDSASVDLCQQQITAYHDAWTDLLTNLPDADMDKIIVYQSLRGEANKTQLSDIFAHLINHGTHTRAQIGQQLKFTGAQTLPITDYSYYLRQLNS